MRKKSKKLLIGVGVFAAILGAAYNVCTEKTKSG